jgi:hypothetical protein
MLHVQESAFPKWAPAEWGSRGDRGEYANCWLLSMYECECFLLYINKKDPSIHSGQRIVGYIST